MDKQGTWIDGISCSENIDSSGERIEIEGVDISSLTKDAVFNYEHTNNTPSSIVGKIYQAKKIMKKSDCENDRHEYFWEKVNMPYIYVAGELFDGVGHKQAQEVAAMLRYDENLKKNNKLGEVKKLINFSIEGSNLKKEGHIIKKCIARKVSITITPCNKVCEAEAMPKEGETKSLIDVLLKKAETYSCEIMKDESGQRTYFKEKAIPKAPSDKAGFAPLPKSFVGKESMKEANPHIPKNVMPAASTPKNAQMKVGEDRILHTPNKMKTGHQIYNDPKTWAKEPSTPAMPKAVKPAMPGKMRSGKDIYNDPDTWKSEKEVKIPAKELVEEHKNLINVLDSKSHKDDKKESKKQKKELKGYKKKLTKFDSNVRKAIAAGSSLGSPSTKVQGDAVAKSEITKKDVLRIISEENWSTFSKKEELLGFIKNKFPEYSELEVTALAKTVAFYNEKKKEHKMSDLMNQGDKTQPVVSVSPKEQKQSERRQAKDQYSSSIPKKEMPMNTRSQQIDEKSQAQKQRNDFKQQNMGSIIDFSPRDHNRASMSELRHPHKHEKDAMPTDFQKLTSSPDQEPTVSTKPLEEYAMHKRIRTGFDALDISNERKLRGLPPIDDMNKYKQAYDDYVKAFQPKGVIYHPLSRYQFMSYANLQDPSHNKALQGNEN